MTAGPLTKPRGQGVQITFDDFCCTESHVKLWARLSRRHGNRLAAKGIEAARDIVALDEAGVECGQGHFLGSPDAEPTEYLNKRAREALVSGWGIDVPC